MQIFTNPDKASRKSTLEVQQMEAQMQHSMLLHKKSLSDRQQHINTLTAGIGKKTKLNKQLQQQIMEIADLLDDQVPAIDAMTAKQDTSRSASVLDHIPCTPIYSLKLSTCPQKCCRPRAKALASSKKLRDIAKAQQIEVSNLKSTLHKLHLRSYPAFVHPAGSAVAADHAGQHPDHAPKDSIRAARGRPGDVL